MGTEILEDNPSQNRPWLVETNACHHNAWHTVLNHFFQISTTNYYISLQPHYNFNVYILFITQKYECLLFILRRVRKWYCIAHFSEVPSTCVLHGCGTCRGEARGPWAEGALGSGDLDPRLTPHKPGGLWACRLTPVNLALPSVKLDNQNNVWGFFPL